MIPITVLGKAKKIHFIGIGGIGMSGLAEYFLKEGHYITGSDLQITAVTERLKKLGAKIFDGHSRENVSDDTELIVYTSALCMSNPELEKARELNIKTIKRAELLGEIVNSKYLIAVSGTHGKTTTTAMIAKLLIDEGLDPLVFIGGNVQFFNGGASRLGRGKYAVVEADEYDRSFLTLRPDIAVITNIDRDHMDIYKNLEEIKEAFKQFISNSKADLKIVYCGDDNNIESVLKAFDCEKISYGFDSRNLLRVQQYEIEKGYFYFSILNSENAYDNIKINLIGKHNVLNSAACFAVSKLLGVDFRKFKQSINDFLPVNRRLQLKYDRNCIKIYDDYAHHPAEIKASLEGLREINGSKRIISVFQPHLFSRTKDFYKEFASSLSEADKIVLTEIYPAREEPIENITSELIFNELLILDANVRYFKNKKELIKQLAEIVKENDIIVFQGAGDITNICDEFILKLSEKKK
jgi:UDP-N-acetylmuramate--alanine ligase